METVHAGRDGGSSQGTEEILLQTSCVPCSATIAIGLVVVSRFFPPSRESERR